MNEMTLSQLVALGSLILAILTFVFGIVRNSKKDTEKTVKSQTEVSTRLDNVIDNQNRLQAAVDKLSDQTSQKMDSMDNRLTTIETTVNFDHKRLDEIYKSRKEA